MMMVIFNIIFLVSRAVLNYQEEDDDDDGGESDSSFFAGSLLSMCKRWMLSIHIMGCSSFH